MKLLCCNEKVIMHVDSTYSMREVASLDERLSPAVNERTDWLIAAAYLTMVVICAARTLVVVKTPRDLALAHFLQLEFPGADRLESEEDLATTLHAHQADVVDARCNEKFAERQQRSRKRNS
eukprot:scaffold1272_cov99-Skeletonema_dohrnii-CCMP3373.AAC.2